MWHPLRSSKPSDIIEHLKGVAEKHLDIYTRLRAIRYLSGLSFTNSKETTRETATNFLLDTSISDAKKVELINPRNRYLKIDDTIAHDLYFLLFENVSDLSIKLDVSGYILSNWDPTDTCRQDTLDWVLDQIDESNEDNKISQNACCILLKYGEYDEQLYAKQFISDCDVENVACNNVNHERELYEEAIARYDFLLRHLMPYDFEDTIKSSDDLYEFIVEYDQTDAFWLTYKNVMNKDVFHRVLTEVERDFINL
jgi:hypothetical protein